MPQSQWDSFSQCKLTSRQRPCLEERVDNGKTLSIVQNVQNDGLVVVEQDALHESEKLVRYSGAAHRCGDVERLRKDQIEKNTFEASFVPP